MKWLSTNQIRRSYLDFFISKGHTEWPSDSLMPSDDPTLLFTGAGMNQFKDMFMGKGTLSFSTATTAQKCLRTGDIDNVGRTNFHQTFFEMMGNFSFGDYFKREAINLAFEWLTDVLEMPPERLYFSVYLDDDEAYDCWEEVCKRVGLNPKRRIFRLKAKDNFWPADAPSKGPNGPCGPCSEIFFDVSPTPSTDEPVDITSDGDRFVEIWNLVFTQFNRQGVDNLVPLPQKNIDTGLGLERVVAVVQGVKSNYEIDIFQPIIAHILQLFGAGRELNELDPVGIQCVRRIADHIRAVAFCITDGIIPGNAERGYVIRRLIRRAFLDVSYLVGNYETTGLSEIIPTVAKVMADPYPDVERRMYFAMEIVAGEERDFIRTLEANKRRLGLALERANIVEGKRVVPGDVAFKLFDTYGVPIEVMVDYFERLGASVELKAFEEAVTERRIMSRKTSKMKGDIFDLGPLGKAFDVTTETKYLGQETREADGLKLLMLFSDNEPVVSAGNGDKVILVFDKTPFYGESGGQVGDIGDLFSSGGTRIRVTGCKRIKKVFFHYGEILSGRIEGIPHEPYPIFESPFFGRIDVENRRASERNHTATHLLHWALREVVGRHCEQAGSLVEPNRLRFDFTHFKPLTPDEIWNIEELVSKRIIENHPIKCYEDTIENAKRTGVIALFGEKYGKQVRVVDIGGFSKELCGGCHVRATGEIGSFHIVSEEGIAAGMRRITAYTGMGTVRYVRGSLDNLSATGGALGVKGNAVPERVQTLITEGKAIRNELRMLKEKLLRVQIADAKPEDIAGIPAFILDVGETEADIMRNVMDSLKTRVKGGLILLAAVTGDNVTLIMYLDDALVKQGWRAGDLIRPVAAEVGGKGGGRPNLAQAGGKNPKGLPKALEVLRTVIRHKVEG